MERPTFDEKEQKLEESVFFVEANSFETFTLWQQNKDIFKQDMAGFAQCVGLVNGEEDMQCWVSFSFAHIHGQRVCFYHTTSRFVDNLLVEEFLTKNYPVTWDNGTRRAMTDANNFHHAIDHCEYLCKKQYEEKV